MTLRHLRIYTTVCKTGTLTEAAKKLYIAQPTVSLAISELEQHFGVKLFDRIANRLHITEHGKEFLHYAEHIIQLYDDMEYHMKNGDVLGSLRIGSSITIATCFLPQFITRLKQLHPQLHIHVTVQNSNLIEDAILNNTIDIGLIEGQVHTPHIHYEDFQIDNLVFICPPTHVFAHSSVIHINELENANFLLRERGSAGREIFEGLMDTHAICINRIWESTSTQAIIQGVSAGLGLSILPYLLAKEHLDRGTICAFSLTDIPLIRNYSIIHHSNKFLTQSTKDFISICKSIT